MTTAHIDYDAQCAVNQTIEFNPDGSFTIGTEQDIEPILKKASDLRKGFSERAGWQGDQHHVAIIPKVILDDMFRSGMINDPEAIRAWCNKPENKMFRTRPGRV